MEMSYDRIIKVGGSVLTGNGNKPCIDVKNTLRLFEELQPVYETCLMVHGTGNFGKPPAIRYGYYHTGLLDNSKRSIALKIRRSLKELNNKVVEILRTLGIPAAGILIEKYYDAEKQSIDVNKLQALISGMNSDTTMPVLFGDLLELPNGNLKVMSSDQIVCDLVKIIKPQSTIFLSDVDGVFFSSNNSENGVKYLSHELNTSNIDQLYKSSGDHYDVSGGMSKKAAIALEICRYSKECFIGNGRTPGLLEDLLNKRKVKGTYVREVKA